MSQSVPFRPVRLDLSMADVREPSVRIPVGYYLVECEGCDAPVQTATSTTSRFLFRVVQGSDAHPNAGLGARLRETVTVESIQHERNHFPLSNALVALGRADIVEAFEKMTPEQQNNLSLERLAQVFVRISAAIKGKRCVADVRDFVGRAQPTSTIEALYAEVRWDEFKRATGYQAEGPTGMGPVPVQPVGPNGPTGGTDVFADLDRVI